MDHDDDPPTLPRLIAEAKAQTNPHRGPTLTWSIDMFRFVCAGGLDENADLRGALDASRQVLIGQAAYVQAFSAKHAALVTAARDVVAVLMVDNSCECLNLLHRLVSIDDTDNTGGGQ